MAIYKNPFGGYVSSAFRRKYSTAVKFRTKKGDSFIKYFKSHDSALRAKTAWQNKGGYVIDVRRIM